jgi:hypothetical protein
VVLVVHLLEAVLVEVSRIILVVTAKMDLVAVAVAHQVLKERDVAATEQL